MTNSPGCVGSCGAEAFALRVVGESMSPEFENGNIIIVDPEAVVFDGCFVVARHAGEYLFRQLKIDGEVYRLKVLDGSEEEVIIDTFDALTGVVVQRSDGRRKNIKHYNVSEKGTDSGRQ